MKKLIILILISLLFLSCKTKKIVSNQTKTDTIFKSEIIKITPARLNQLTIDSPCDSLGKLKPFNYTLSSGNDKIIVKTLHNTIYVEQNLDSIKQVWKKEYESHIDTKDTVVRVEVKNPLNFYLLLYSIVITMWVFRSPLKSIIRKSIQLITN